MFEQERFVGRLQRYVLGEATVLGCYLSGSFGRRTEDAFSDVDVILLYQDDPTREAAWGRRQTLAKGVMPYVAVRSFDADHVTPYLHCALYANGTKADYRYRTTVDLEPNPWDREIRVLKDTGRWAEQFQAAASRLAPPQPFISLDELTTLDNRFWVMLWDVVRLVKRGDPDKPFAVYLQLLNFALPPLLSALPAEDAARQGLVRVTYSRDTAVTMRGLVDLLNAYLAARSAVVRRQNLAFLVDTAFESEIRRYIERSAG